MKRVLAVVATFWAAGAMADGNELLKQCQDAVKAYDSEQAKNLFDVGMCFGTLNGVTQTLRFLRVALDAKPLICIPEDVPNIQLIRVINKFLLENPASLNNEGGGLVVVALMNAYPCKE